MIVGLAVVALVGAGGWFVFGRSHNAAPAPSPNTTHRLTDQQIADSITLTASDVPGAWIQGPIQPNDETGDAQTARCLGVPNTDSQQTAYAGSPTFSRIRTRVFAQAVVFRSTASVQSDIGAVKNPRLTRCLAQNLGQHDGATHVELTKIALPPSVRTLTGFQLVGTANIVAQGVVHHMTIDEIGLAKGRIEVSIDAIAIDSLVPNGLVGRASSALAAKLARTAT
jgi:hypothetical protein